jgi:transcriptional regulator with XRE-family HTH domain
MFDLKQELKKRGLSKADLSRLSGVSKATLGILEEKGVAGAHSSTMRSITEAFAKHDAASGKIALPADTDTDRLKYAIFDGIDKSWPYLTEDERNNIIEPLRKAVPGAILEQFLKYLKNQRS